MSLFTASHQLEPLLLQKIPENFTPCLFVKRNMNTCNVAPDLSDYNQNCLQVAVCDWDNNRTAILLVDWEQGTVEETQVAFRFSAFNQLITSFMFCKYLFRSLQSYHIPLTSLSQGMRLLPSDLKHLSGN